MIRHSRFALISVQLTCAIVSTLPCGLGAETAKSNRYEKSIQRFEERDREKPPRQDWVLFVGSSSIRGWKLEQSFPGKGFINRGFGGSQTSDLLHFVDRIVIPYRPRAVVIYEGDNDIASRKSPARVLADFKAVVKRVHEALPKTHVLFISIKPSLKRWALVGKMREANQLVRQLTEGDERLHYVDIDTPMVGPDGKPRPELFRKDGLHLKPEGYKVWADALEPYLKPYVADGGEVK